MCIDDGIIDVDDDDGGGGGGCGVPWFKCSPWPEPNPDIDAYGFSIDP